MSRSSSSSASSNTTNTLNEDSRVATDNGGIGVSTDGNVSLQITADEAFELGENIIQVASDLARQSLDLTERAGAQAFSQTATASANVGRALDTVLEKNRPEDAQLSSELIRIGIPAAAIAFVISRVLK